MLIRPHMLEEPKSSRRQNKHPKMDAHANVTITSNATVRAREDDVSCRVKCIYNNYLLGEIKNQPQKANGMLDG